MHSTIGLLAFKLSYSAWFAFDDVHSLFVSLCVSVCVFKTAPALGGSAPKIGALWRPRCLEYFCYT